MPVHRQDGGEKAEWALPLPVSPEEWWLLNQSAEPGVAQERGEPPARQVSPAVWSLPEEPQESPKGERVKRGAAQVHPASPEGSW